MRELKMLSLFSGIGAFEKALDNLGIEYSLINFSEIDKFAIKSYCAIHNTSEDKNLGDISKIDIDKLPKNIDIITHGSPCQDYSMAGKQQGGNKGSGTRSSLMWYSVEIIRHCKPKYVIWENVKNVLSKKHKHNFEQYMKDLEDMGYDSYYKILNAKNYGIPQNRERIYCISILGEHEPFNFPQPFELKLKLRDMLEDSVENKYYTSNEMTNKLVLKKTDGDIKQIGFIKKSKEGTQHQSNTVYDSDSISRTLTAVDYKSPLMITEDNFEQDLDNKDINPIRLGGIFDKEGKIHQAGSVWEKDSISPTLDTMQGGYRQPCIIDEKYYLSNKMKEYILDIKNSQDGTKWSGQANNGVLNRDIANTLSVRGAGGYQRAGISNFLIEDIDEKIKVKEIKEMIKDKNDSINDLRIRKLTPLECWRLMGFYDEDFYKAKNVPTSDTQLYKQAGNSIVVNVLEEIFKNLFQDKLTTVS